MLKIGKICYDDRVFKKDSPMTIVRPTLNDIYSPIEKELGEFSDRLRRELASDDPLIHEIHSHLLKMTGKFLRPALALVSTSLGGGAPTVTADSVKLAVAIELIHTATLVHDDIIDGSELRRHQPSVYSKWGREISIVSGDYLYAKAFMLLAGLKDAWLSQAFAACAHTLCEGEMKQIEMRNRFLMSEADYLKIIHQKTAALFQAACMGGARLSGTDPESVRRLGDYGFGLGMAFQIVDDCLDLGGVSANLGKSTGLDIIKNDVSLPILYLFQDLDESGKTSLFRDIQSGRPDLLEKIRGLATEKKSVEKAREKAKEYVDQSLQSLCGFENSVYKDSLTQLALYCLERVC